VVQPLAVSEPTPKTLMQRIFESQRQEGARRLAATIVHCYDKPVQDIELACSDLEDITSALNSFQAHFAAGERVGAVPGRMIKE